MLLCRFIDSSEMVSTFGSSPHEVRGFIARGWTACQNREGGYRKIIGMKINLCCLIKFAGDLSGVGQLYSISLADFERDILPNLQEHDSIIWFNCKGHSETCKSDDDEIQLHALVEK